MLFNPAIEPSCSYCAKGTCLSDGNIICTKYGLIRPAQNCIKFVYAPRKRIPPRPPVLPEYNSKDFSID